MPNVDDVLGLMQENPFLLKRVELLKSIETTLKDKLDANVAVVSYIANTTNPALGAASSMNISHLTYLEDLIKKAKGDRNILVIILESYGGEATFPIEFLKLIKGYYGKFYIVVVKIAKSAATVISLLSDGIIALSTASFGPIDPQLIYTTPDNKSTVTSARSVIDLFDKT